MENLIIATLKSESGQLNINWFIEKLRFIEIEYSGDPQAFVVDLEDIANAIDYRKDNLKALLLKSPLEQNLDYKIQFLKFQELNGIVVKYPRMKENIMLTVDAAKNLALQTQSKSGHKFRKYFINAERELRQEKSKNAVTIFQLQELQNQLVEREKEIKALKSRLDNQTTKLEAELSHNELDCTECKYDAFLIFLYTGIKDYYYFTNALKDRYRYDVDYQMVKYENREVKQGRYKYLVTGKTMYSLLLTFRSKKGLDKRSLPEIYRELVKQSLGENINSRELRSR